MRSDLRLRNALVIATGLAGVLPLACAKPPDTGIVLGCFGFINETVPTDDVTSTVPTNIFYGGCKPEDPGLQFLVQALPTASQDDIVSACDAACKERFGFYGQSHPSIAPLLPSLSCQTLFATQCDGIVSNSKRLPAGTTAHLQAGGPTDSRFALTGTATITLDHRSVNVSVTGAADVTIAEDCDQNNVCPLIMSRFEVAATGPFTLNGMLIDSAQVQNQAVVRGKVTNQAYNFFQDTIFLEVSYSSGGQVSGFSVVNDDEQVSHPQSGDNLAQFFPDLDQFFGDGALHLRLHATLDQRRPMASLAPLQDKYECTCTECTSVTLVSTSKDLDNDLQNMTWKVTSKLMGDKTSRTNIRISDGADGQETLPLQLALGSYAVDLFVNDTRGAASHASKQFDVVDTIAPKVTPPPAATMLSCGFPAIGQATATDICSDVIVTSNDPGVFFPGTKTVTFRAEDSSLNDGFATATMTQTVPGDGDRDDLVQCCPPGTNIMWALPGQTLIGTDGPDCLIGTDSNNTIYGMGGNDYIIGGLGNDHLYGGEGDDTIVGNQGDDYIEGGGGTDRIAGGTGNDTIYGDNKDLTTATDGDDFVLAGLGDDVVDGGEGSNTIMGGPGRDKLQAGSGNDWIDGGEGPDWILGGAGNDTLIGGTGNDRDHIEGGPDNDLLAGLDGDDELDGGPGDDDIRGGKGNNTCTGGGDTDKFRFCQTIR